MRRVLPNLPKKEGGLCAEWSIPQGVPQVVYIQGVHTSGGTSGGVYTGWWVSLGVSLGWCIYRVVYTRVGGVYPGWVGCIPPYICLPTT